MSTDEHALNPSSLFSVEGLVAVVTGGGTGIGLMMTKALESNGATVYILGRRLEVLEKAAKENSKHGKIIPIRCDVTIKESLQEAVSFIKSQTGYINLLVNNSGVMGAMYHLDKPKSGSLEDLQQFLWNRATPDEFTNVLHINVTGVWYTTVAFLALLGEGNKEGRGIPGVVSQVITVASIGGLRRDATVMSPAYSASKSAAIHMGKILSNYLRDYDIRSNIIAPGLFESEMTSDVIQESYPRDVVPLQRSGDELDMGGFILSLASRAGAYLNGNVTVLDGGRLGTFPSTY